MEAQFACNVITKDLTKYYHVLQSLDSDVISEISELIMNPPQHGKYEALKSRVIFKFRDNAEKRLRAWLNQVELGDQRISTFFKIHERFCRRQSVRRSIKVVMDTVSRRTEFLFLKSPSGLLGSSDVDLGQKIEYFPFTWFVYWFLYVLQATKQRSRIQHWAGITSVRDTEPHWVPGKIVSSQLDRLRGAMCTARPLLRHWNDYSQYRSHYTDEATASSAQSRSKPRAKKRYKQTTGRRANKAPPGVRDIGTRHETSTARTYTTPTNKHANCICYLW